MTSQEIDAVVLSVMLEEPLRFSDVRVRVNKALLNTVSHEGCPCRQCHPIDPRKIDRSLQRLKRAGKIQLAKGRGGGWRKPMPAMPRRG